MNSRNMIIIGLLLCLTIVSSGCSGSKKDTSELLVVGEDYADSAEETQEETTELTETADTVEDAETQESDVEDVESTGMISVYICGAVYEAGVYELEDGSRVYHVIDLAGGMTEDAMETYLNQAQELVDGQKIYVPTKEEVENGSVEIEAAASESSSDATSTGESSGKVNINTASIEELCTLTGIGEAKAASIISYREENGDFTTIEGLLNISGIKEGTYSQLEDEVTVD